MNYKVEAIDRLSKLGLPVPWSFTISLSELQNLNKILAEFSAVDLWFLRSPHTEEDIIPKRIVTASELENALNICFLKKPTAKIVVQERIDVSYSGVFYKSKDFLFVEYVSGGLQSLLRDGVTPSRVIFDYRGNILANQENKQEFWYRWERDKLITAPATKPKQLPIYISRLLLEAASLIEETVIFDWVEDRRGNVFFIDMRNMQDQFLIDKESLLAGFKRDRIITLDIPIQGRIIKSIKDSGSGVFLLALPLYEHVKDILDRATAIVIGKGGSLSHLIVYAADRNIPCVLSSACYHRLLEA